MPACAWFRSASVHIRGEQLSVTWIYPWIRLTEGGRTVSSGVKAGGAQTDLSGSSYRERLAPAPGAL